MRGTKIILLAVFFGLWSCDVQEENISYDPALQLLFSSDTVHFDTLLTDIQSPVQRLTVFNPNSSAIQLSSILLGQGDASDYSLIINGKQQNEVNGEVIFGGDSIQILVDVDIDPRNLDLPYLVKDSIVFFWNENSEHVKLVSWGQDATPLGQQTLCDEIWTNDRPYILSDTLLVQQNCQLTIEKGAQIFFQNDAVLFVQGSLIARGDSADQIVFTSSRFDSGFDQVPGQWQGIYFLEGSKDNELAYVQLSNAQIGLRVGTPDEDDDPDVLISNTEIFNMSVAGILGFTSDIQAQNTLIYNCGTYLVGGFLGGNYTYNHCTFSNESSAFIQDEPSVQYSDNLVVSDDEILVAELAVSMENTIVWGANDEELLINNGGGTTPIVFLRSNIIRSAEELENNITSLEFNYPGFTAPFLYDYSLDTLSNAQDIGAQIGIPDDITGALRDSLPDIGAYERIE